MKPKLLFCLGLVLSGNCYAAIVYPKAPDGGRQIAIENVGRILRAQNSFLGGLRIEDLTIANPYQEYLVGQTNLASGRLLSAAKLGGWRCLLIHGTNAVGAAELIADEKTGKALKFSSIQQPFFPDATLEALRIAEQLPQVKKSDYELRYLDIMHTFVVVWLHGKSDDIIIPIPPTFAPLNSYQPYSEKQIIKLLKPEAKKKLKELPGMGD